MVFGDVCRGSEGEEKQVVSLAVAMPNALGEQLINFSQFRLVVQVSQVRINGCQITPAGRTGLNGSGIRDFQPLANGFGNDRPQQVEFQPIPNGQVTGQCEQVVGKVTGKDSRNV